MVLVFVLEDLLEDLVEDFVVLRVVELAEVVVVDFLVEDSVGVLDELVVAAGLLSGCFASSVGGNRINPSTKKRMDTGVTIFQCRLSAEDGFERSRRSCNKNQAPGIVIASPIKMAAKKPANPPYVGEVIRIRNPNPTETQARAILMREPLPGCWVENCPGVVNVRPFNYLPGT